MRLIDADMLPYENAVMSYDDEWCLYMHDIESAPTIDPESLVKRGRWDEIPNTYMSVASKDGSYSGNATSCSVCNEINPNAYKTNYCPNCGAKMDGGKG